MHDDFIKSEAVANKVKDTGIRRFSHWPTKRVEHAFKSLEKMQQAFRRCGSVDDSYSQISTLSTDVCQASNEILAAFSHWAETHLHECRNYQVHTDRMNKKWNDIYNKVLGCDANQSVIVSTTGSTIESTTSTSTDKCDIIGGWTDQCSEKCYTYVHEYEYIYDYETFESHFGDFACELKISSVCDPNFVDIDGHGCDWYDHYLHGCEFYSNKDMLEWGVFSVADGYKTGLNCPVCGCDENGPINMYDRDHIRSLASDVKKIKNSRKK